MTDIEKLKKLVPQIKRDILRMVHSVASGHPGGSLGCTEFMTALYFDIMHIKPGFDMDGKEEDIFFLSNGHIAPLWYSVLARKGFFPLKELAGFRRLNSRLQGHPATAEGLPGIRIASGSLGQGLSVALGAALAKKMNDDQHLVFSLHGDGECEEGQIWEAAMAAAHYKADNLISTFDRNGLQIDGSTEEVFGLGDLAAKLQAFGWLIIETKKGNDVLEMQQVIEKAKQKAFHGKPVAIVMHTIMGAGVDFMENKHHWHGVAPNDDELALALQQLTETLGDYPL